MGYSLFVWGFGRIGTICYRDVNCNVLVDNIFLICSNWIKKMKLYSNRVNICKYDFKTHSASQSAKVSLSVDSFLSNHPFKQIYWDTIYTLFWEKRRAFSLCIRLLFARDKLMYNDPAGNLCQIEIHVRVLVLVQNENVKKYQS